MSEAHPPTGEPRSAPAREGPAHGLRRGTLAAVDLGSNSFHMIVGQVRDGHVQIVDRLRDPVRLAQGLKRGGGLGKGATRRALDALERFGQRIRHLPVGCVRVVGTNTLRRARRVDEFLALGGELLGHPIEIISGQEEGRLIYIGAAHDVQPPGGRRLCVDIGGGSTEVVLGEGSATLHSVDSLGMGCVAWTDRFFAKGRITRKAMQKAITAARLELEPIRRRVRKAGWEHCLGASGTIRAAASLAESQGLCGPALSADAMQSLVAYLVELEDPAGLVGPHVAADRAPVFAGGAAILAAIFEDLRIERMQVADGALREGVLYDLLGRIQEHDVREVTIDRLMARHDVDRRHANRVAATATGFLDQVGEAWQLDDEASRRLLSWAARVHEIGMSIAWSGYQKHGAYLLLHGNLPGFSRTEQRLLSTLVLSHRRKPRPADFDRVPPDRRKAAIRLTILLRLAVRLHRARSTRKLPDITLLAKGRRLTLSLPSAWLDEHPLTRADLELEQSRLARVGYELVFPA